MPNYTRTKISCYLGYFIQAIIVCFLPLTYVTLNSKYNISYEKLGVLSIITFAVQLCVDVLSVKLLKYIGYRGGVILAHLLSVIGFVLIAVLPDNVNNAYAAIVVSCMFYSVGGGLIEVVISPIIEYLPTKNKASQMSLLHSFFCWGQILTILLTTVLFIVFGRENWNRFAYIWAAISFINMMLFIKAPIIEPEEDKSESNKKIFASPFFYGVMILMFAAGAAEIAVSQWASAFAEEGLGLSKTLGDLAGPCAFALLMGIGRLLYGIYGSKIKIEKVLLCCGILCFGCYMLLALSENPIVSLLACAFCGLSVSVMWPGALSIGSAHFPKGGTMFFGFAAAFGDIGCSVGPWIVGTLTESHSMRDGFLVCSVFPVIITVTIICFLKYSCQKGKNVLK